MKIGWLVLAAVLSVALGSRPIQAADPAGHAAASEHGGKSKQLPSFIDIKRYDLGIYTLVVFLGLFFILSRVAWKPIIEGLDKREHNIRHAFEEAAKAREEAKALEAKFEREIAQANEKVRAMMDQARTDAEKLKAELQAQAKAEIQTERERLRREIDTARDQALQDIWNRAVQLASVLSTKAIKRSISEDDHRRLIEEAREELQAIIEARRA